MKQRLEALRNANETKPGIPRPQPNVVSASEAASSGRHPSVSNTLGGQRPPGSNTLTGGSSVRPSPPVVPTGAAPTSASGPPGLIERNQGAFNALVLVGYFVACRNAGKSNVDCTVEAAIAAGFGAVAQQLLGTARVTAAGGALTAGLMANELRQLVQNALAAGAAVAANQAARQNNLTNLTDTRLDALQKQIDEVKRLGALIDSKAGPLNDRLGQGDAAGRMARLRGFESQFRSLRDACVRAKELSTLIEDNAKEAASRKASLDRRLADAAAAGRACATAEKLSALENLSLQYQTDHQKVKDAYNTAVLGGGELAAAQRQSQQGKDQWAQIEPLFDEMDEWLHGKPVDAFMNEVKQFDLAQSRVRHALEAIALPPEGGKDPNNYRDRLLEMRVEAAYPRPTDVIESIQSRYRSQVGSPEWVEHRQKSRELRALYRDAAKPCDVKPSEEAVKKLSRYAESADQAVARSGVAGLVTQCRAKLECQDPAAVNAVTGSLDRGSFGEATTLIDSLASKGCDVSVLRKQWHEFTAAASAYGAAQASCNLAGASAAAQNLYAKYPKSPFAQSYLAAAQQWSDNQARIDALLRSAAAAPDENAANGLASSASGYAHPPCLVARVQAFRYQPPAPPAPLPPAIATRPAPTPPPQSSRPPPAKPEEKPFACTMQASASKTEGYVGDSTQLKAVVNPAERVHEVQVYIHGSLRGTLGSAGGGVWSRTTKIQGQGDIPVLLVARDKDSNIGCQGNFSVKSKGLPGQGAKP